MYAGDNDFEPASKEARYKKENKEESERQDWRCVNGCEEKEKVYS